jgi:GNAT superfamily N-acetyltransferase
MARGETIVAEDRDLVVGVVTLKRADESHGSPFYERPDVAGFGQFAVRPSHQHRRIGATLLHLVEQRARELDLRFLALDTSEHASKGPPQNDLYNLTEFGTLRRWSVRRDSESGWRPCCRT